MKAMKAQKISLVILGAITLILLMVVLSTVGSLSSIAEQRAANDAKIAAIEQEKAAVQSVWDSCRMNTRRNRRNLYPMLRWSVRTAACRRVQTGWRSRSTR